MPRIRTIKPEFWSDAKVASLSRDARLLFLGLLNEADDEGRLLASPKRIAGVVFPHDADVGPGEIEAWMGELEDSRMIRGYLVEGVPYAEIPNFRKHQRIDKPSASKLPSPKDADDLSDCPLPAYSVKPPGGLPELPTNPPGGTPGRKLEVEVEVGSRSGGVLGGPLVRQEYQGSGEPSQPPDDQPLDADPDPGTDADREEVIRRRAEQVLAKAGKTPEAIGEILAAVPAREILAKLGERAS